MQMSDRIERHDITHRSHSLKATVVNSSGALLATTDSLGCNIIFGMEMERMERMLKGTRGGIYHWSKERDEFPERREDIDS